MRSKLLWFLVFVVVGVLALFVTGLSRSDSGWSGEYVVGDLGGAAPPLGLPLVRGEAPFDWNHEPLDEQRLPCTVALWVEADGDGDGARELFVPHVERLVAVFPEAVRVVWVSEADDDAWLPDGAPGHVAHDASGASHERFGGRRLPFGALVSGRGAILRTGFPTEIDEAAVMRAVSQRSFGRRSRRASSSNAIEPLVYRDTDREKVAVRVIPPDLAERGMRTRLHTSLSRVSYAIDRAPLTEALEQVEPSAEIDTSALPATLVESIVKVDVWLGGIDEPDERGRELARATAFDALLEAFDLRATRRDLDDGGASLVIEPRD